MGGVRERWRMSGDDGPLHIGVVDSDNPGDDRQLGPFSIDQLGIFRSGVGMWRVAENSVLMSSKSIFSSEGPVRGRGDSVHQFPPTDLLGRACARETRRLGGIVQKDTSFLKPFWTQFPRHQTTTTRTKAPPSCFPHHNCPTEHYCKPMTDYTDAI